MYKIYKISSLSLLIHACDRTKEQDCESRGRGHRQVRYKEWSDTNLKEVGFHVYLDQLIPGGKSKKMEEKAVHYCGISKGEMELEIGPPECKGDFKYLICSGSRYAWYRDTLRAWTMILSQ